MFTILTQFICFQTRLETSESNRKQLVGRLDKQKTQVLSHLYLYQLYKKCFLTLFYSLSFYKQGISTSLPPEQQKTRQEEMIQKILSILFKCELVNIETCRIRT